MMRRPLTQLTLVAICGSLALLSGCAAGASRAKTAAVGAGRDPGPTATHARTWTVTLSPAPDDLALAQIAFREAAAGARVTSGSLRVGVSAPFGDDYLAAAAVRLPGPPRVLVLLVNRPSPLLEPVAVHVRLTAASALGTPVISSSSNPFTRPATAPKPSLCDLPLKGAALSASRLRLLRSRGEPLAGYVGASAVAQAYDAVCSLPFANAFEQAVKRPTGSSPPVPIPTPPVGKLPGEGCVPRPGFACPGAVESSLPVVPAAAARRAAAGAH